MQTSFQKLGLHQGPGCLIKKKKQKTTRNTGAFSNKVSPGSPLSQLWALTQGFNAQPSISLLEKTCGSSWHDALGTLWPLLAIGLRPAGPDVWQQHALCCRELLATHLFPHHCYDPQDSHQGAQRTGTPPQLPTPPSCLHQLSTGLPGWHQGVPVPCPRHV